MPIQIDRGATVMMVEEFTAHYFSHWSMWFGSFSI